jgi:hypothetical protein
MKYSEKYRYRSLEYHSHNIIFKNYNKSDFHITINIYNYKNTNKGGGKNRNS